MKVTVLHATDPHSDLRQIEAMIESAPSGALLAVSGDIHNWNGKAATDEIERFLAQLRELARKSESKGCLLAVCSGNHDVWSTPESYSVRSWLELREGNLHGDFWNGIANLGGQKVMLTCIPWRDYEMAPEISLPKRLRSAETRYWACDALANERIVKRLETGKILKDTLGFPWIWLHHNPPSFSAASGFFEASNRLNQWIEKYEPTVVLCGHVHTAPFQKGSQGHTLLGNTLVSNPGRSEGYLRLNKITLEAQNRHWITRCKPIQKRMPARPVEVPPMAFPLTVGGITLMPADDETEQRNQSADASDL